MPTKQRLPLLGSLMGLQTELKIFVGLYVSSTVVKNQTFLVCIKCMRCRQLLPMVAVSVRLAEIGGGARSVRRMPCAQGHSVQRLSNYFNHLLYFSIQREHFTRFYGASYNLKLRRQLHFLA